MVENKRMYSILFISFLALLSLFSIGYTLISEHPQQSQQENSVLKFKNVVCIDVKRADGTIEHNGCSHNIVYNSGINMTRDMLAYDANFSIRNISLCNASTSCGVPVAGGNEAFTAFAGCGMTSGEAAYGVITTTGGNWTEYKSFTSTCNNVVTNLTRLTNTSDSAFAGNTFNLVNLSTNDILTVNWSISVS